MLIYNDLFGVLCALKGGFESMILPTAKLGAILTRCSDIPVRILGMALEITSVELNSK
jgi:hypothetical protein